MHLVSIALEPAKESPLAVPAIIIIIFLAAIGSPFAIDDEFLICRRQLFERNVEVNLFPGACAEQILLGFAEFLPPKYPHYALTDAQAAIGQRFVEVDCNGPTKTATFRT